jgi:1-acyl-sn-glycerol-3-phosphate acyltransferase
MTTMNMLYRISQAVGQTIGKLYFRVRVVGLENIPNEGACILVANHSSFLDPFMLGSFMPRVVHFLTYDVYYSFWLFRWYCQRVYCIPVRKDGSDTASLKKALRVLKDGEILGIFPEGVRSFTGEIGPAEPGTALIVLKANVPVLPVAIQGAYQALPRGAILPKPRPITLTVGAPFRIEEQFDLHALHEKNILYQRVMDRIMTTIAELSGIPQIIPPET